MSHSASPGVRSTTRWCATALAILTGTVALVLIPAPRPAEGEEPPAEPVPEGPDGSLSPASVEDLALVVTVTSGPTLNATANYELTYEVVVSNEGAGPELYDLDLALRFGSGVTVVDAVVDNTNPGTIGTDPGWDGTGEVGVVTGVGIAPTESHTYVVTVEASVDPSTTPAARDCALDGGESGTGFLAEATITSEDEQLSHDDCMAVPPADLSVTKVVSSGPTLNAGSNYDITYEVVVSNEGAGPEQYDLEEALRFGSGITVVDAGVVNTDPGSIVTDPAWDGTGEVGVATEVGIAPTESHTYVVTVEASVDPSTTPAAGDCALGGGESGTGFLAEATITSGGESSSQSACEPIPVPSLTIAATLTTGPTELAGGANSLTYQLVVENEGDDPATYGLADELHFGAGITIDSASVLNVSPGSIAVNPAWDGTTDPQVVTGQSIAAGATHVYEVEVVAVVDASVSVESADCVLAGGETGTGFLATAIVTAPGFEVSSTRCAEATLVADDDGVDDPTVPTTIADPPASPDGETGEAAQSVLPRTGSESRTLVAAALGLVALGLAMLGVTVLSKGRPSRTPDVA